MTPSTTIVAPSGRPDAPITPTNTLVALPIRVELYPARTSSLPTPKAALSAILCASSRPWKLLAAYANGKGADTAIPSGSSAVAHALHGGAAHHSTPLPRTYVSGPHPRGSTEKSPHPRHVDESSNRRRLHRTPRHRPQRKPLHAGRDEAP
eukprot:CAMPEP_0172092950 /NCGR_PEP_ID=MMETSP1043-20130122/25707_1 /TAXON_ID=464988 /ORGANISM="Hemiselmis andersenii, Strain CCMP441" /LENGTH=150 /DNA_ID=CAMNT_0012755689 /DNA_START=4 /DNA_END=452 /DNA_ORIENTATION=+